MIKLTVLLFLVLGILYIYCKISGKENYVDYVSELHCIDSCIIQQLGNNKNINELNRFCKNRCESECKDKNCNYFDKLNFSQSPPEKIHNLRVTVNVDNIYITWFRPKTSKDHPVLRYICIIENDDDKTIEIEIPNKSNSNLVEHYVRGLKPGVYYNIHIYSENDNGLGLPAIIPRIYLKKLDEHQKKKKEIKFKLFNNQFDHILELFNNKNKFRKLFIKLFNK